LSAAYIIGIIIDVYIFDFNLMLNPN